MNKKTILITGGAGFIGANAAVHYLGKKYKVAVYDNLSRAGAKQNLDWLKNQKGNFVFIKGDIRNYKKLFEAFRKYKPDFVLHLAAQVTMVTSVANPQEDFEINALGTFNVLEALRKGTPQASLIYSSTNKVYGEMTDIPIIETKKRYIYKNIKGISESQSLDFHGPYGCSKGTGDQYTLDYMRIYGLNTVVSRQSGIYGPHQFGIEEQGWLAWFCNTLLFDKAVTIYGNGKQVRDVLYVDDLLRAFDLIFKNIEKTRGRVYNMGGGFNFSLSIWELFYILEKLSGKKINYSFDGWRAGDQKVYVSDLTNAKKDFGWAPKVSPKEGVKRLYNWISQNKNLIKKAGVFKG
ncbi:MAG TPA: SDR family NAD(P)-dependent oxidoreductase [Candidatus Humimicrobiaceae bacterium]|nr:SDR family NAD(P)-dependent oxidoreductase [Candidatus Humimicrobiaceae bacterium]